MSYYIDSVLHLNDFVEKSEKLVGGKADGASDSEFPKDKLKAGMKVESEHTDDKQQAKEIAKDHLKEDPQYYVKLEKIEKSGLGKPHKYLRKYRKGTGWIYVYHEGEHHKMLSEEGVAHLHALHGLGHEQTKHLMDNAEEVDVGRLKLIKELADLGHGPAQKMMAEHNADAVKALFDKKDPKQFDNWVMPNEEQTKQEYEWEYKKHPDLFGHDDVFPTLDSWKKALASAKIETLTDAADKKIGRRTFVSSLAELKGIVAGYKHPRDVGKIEQGFNQHAAMPLPIVIERADGSRFVLGGNTRLSTASVMGVTKKALIVKIPEKGIEELKKEVGLANSLSALQYSKNTKIKALGNALSYWTGSGYQYIRPLQQGKTSMDKTAAEKHLKALDEAYDLLPVYDGPIKRVTRQTQEKIDKLYKNDNKLFTMDAYSSFAKMTGSYDTSPSGEKCKVTILVKKNLSGKNIHRLSNHPSEHEVLVAKGAKYRVLKFEQSGKYVKVEVEEVLDKSWVEADEETNRLWNDQFDEPMGFRDLSYRSDEEQ